MVEIAPSQRAELACELLLDAAHRPGIIYTPTRKQADALAAELGRLVPAAAYHAGLDAEHRKRVQEEFLGGRIEVMVATIAFGMGIDKPDIRTVIHTALAGSIEAYYQEIGRAGRDGKPSRAVLMHSYADRYTHDFFFERDYPDVAVLDEIFKQLRSEPQEKAALQKRLRMSADIFEKALEKLWIHGGAVIDFADNVCWWSSSSWRNSYIAHGEQKRAQIDQVIRYAESNQCRMSTLVRHFGDFADGETAVRNLRFLRSGAVCRTTVPDRHAEAERAVLFRVIAALRAGDGKSTGKLHSELCPDGAMSRDSFEEVLGAMARAGLVRLSDAMFEKDGKQIPYRKVSLTRVGHSVDEQTPIEFIMKVVTPPSAKRKGKKRASRASETEAPEETGEGRTAKTRPSRPFTPDRIPESKGLCANGVWPKPDGAGYQRFGSSATRHWQAIARQRPRTAQELLAISGIGIATVEKYGQQIYRIVNDNNR